jgi:NADH-quinone oxidoreductase subunit E
MQPFAKPAGDLRLRSSCRVESLGHPVEFGPERMAEFRTLLGRYPTKQAALLPTLWMAQQEWGWISTEVIDYVSGLLELPPSHVYGVVSFYTMYNRAPVGKYHIQICTNLSCQLAGAEPMLRCLQDKLGIGLNETTADGLFTLSEVECLAACEMAPMIQIGDEFIGPLTPESISELIDRLRSESR